MVDRGFQGNARQAHPTPFGSEISLLVKRLILVHAHVQVVAFMEPKRVNAH
jgi:hypothetical protein